jgi:hypothetical protein
LLRKLHVIVSRGWGEALARGAEITEYVSYLVSSI